VSISQDIIDCTAGRTLWFVCGWQVKLCDTFVTHGPYLSAFEMYQDKTLYKFTLLYYPYVLQCRIHDDANTVD